MRWISRASTSQTGIPDAYLTDYRITKREAEVLALPVTGLTSSEIGNKLFISQRTVEAHTQGVYGKYDVGNRVELAAKLTSHSPLVLPKGPPQVDSVFFRIPPALHPYDTQLRNREANVPATAAISATDSNSLPRGRLVRYGSKHDLLHSVMPERRVRLVTDAGEELHTFTEPEEVNRLIQRAIVTKDIREISANRMVVVPMIGVPLILCVVLPAVMTLLAFKLGIAAVQGASFIGYFLVTNGLGLALRGIMLVRSMMWIPGLLLPAPAVSLLELSVSIFISMLLLGVSYLLIGRIGPRFNRERVISTR